MDRTSQAEETVRRYSDMVYRLAFARTGNTADAEDVYQEVFLRYLRSDPQFTSEEHRKAWLLPGHYQLRQKASCGALAAADGAPQ